MHVSNDRYKSNILKRQLDKQLALDRSVIRSSDSTNRRSCRPATSKHPCLTTNRGRPMPAATTCSIYHTDRDPVSYARCQLPDSFLLPICWIESPLAYHGLDDSCLLGIRLSRDKCPSLLFFPPCHWCVGRDSSWSSLNPGYRSPHLSTPPRILLGRSAKKYQPMLHANLEKIKLAWKNIRPGLAIHRFTVM